MSKTNVDHDGSDGAPGSTANPLLGTMIDLKPLGDARGSLVAIEDFKVGFPIKRVYYLFGTQPGVSRGFHAHQDLRQIVVAVTGACDFVLDDGQTRTTIRLADPTKGLFVEPMVWHEMHAFTPDCVLLVIASDNYDERDYIRSYDDFRQRLDQGRLPSRG